MNDGAKLTVGRPDINKAIIPSTQISDSTSAGRALLTASTVQTQRTALDIFVSATNLAAFPANGNFQRAYIAQDTGKIYTWNGSGYTEISPNTHTRTGTNNINVGETALASASLAGSHNTAVGAGALQSNTLGATNSAVGVNALFSNSEGGNNSALGAGALQSNTLGATNSAVGVNALFSNSRGGNNSALGAGALQSNDIGENNSAVGAYALYNNVQGSNNVAIGANAGSNLDGSNNTLVGASSQVDVRTRIGCVALGFGAMTPPVNGSLAIGGAGGNAMANLITGTNGAGTTSYLRIWLNGKEYRISAVAAD